MGFGGGGRRVFVGYFLSPKSCTIGFGGGGRGVVSVKGLPFLNLRPVIFL
jgi:hypothetical protein